MKTTTSSMDGRIKINWNNEEIVTFVINGKVWTKFDLLVAAADADEEGKAWNFMNIASRLFHAQGDSTFHKLYGAVAMEITRTFTQSEYQIHGLFKKRFSDIYPEYKLIQKKNNSNHIPDAWVKYDGNEIPVEMKLEEFDERALIQLSRYMDVYDKTEGIAVGRTLTVELPPNVRFISISELEQCRRTRHEQ